MEPAFRSLLYDRPDLYDLVFPEPDQTRAETCREAFKRYLPLPPTSLLDIGCGNGRLLASLSVSIPSRPSNSDRSDQQIGISAQCGSQ